ncbi:MAG: transaldolase [Gemmatimonas sp.]|nr:transaldolase [Gemmatimonas sp.]
MAKSGPLWGLTELGQSVWLDYIRKGILDNGELERLIREDAVRGVTSNPAIFEQAIGRSDDYDDVLATLAAEGIEPIVAYETLAIDDIRRAADLFRGLYDETGGGDGFVSLEVSPELAHDTQGSLEEARRLWTAVDRPNVMIKIPGTAAGLPAIEEALFEGINVNVTLLFSLGGYEKVMERYLKALERRAERGLPLAHLASVASFFVSRVDTSVDAALERRAEQSLDEKAAADILALRGRAAVANAKLAYQHFTLIFGGQRFASLREKGAHVQRPLWASTSTKNPSYRDVLYVEELIGPDTVNTMPLATLEAFADHGEARRRIDHDVDAARRDLRAIQEAGIDLDDVTRELQRGGVEKFVLPFRDLLASIEAKLVQVAGAPYSQSS